jgi:glycosyltransferase involved in cell wall biosynthesis
MSPDQPTAGERMLVLTQDPRFHGGALAQLRAFLRAAQMLGSDPVAAYARRPPLTGKPPLQGISVSTPLARVDPVGLPLAARRLRRAVASAERLWVVAATAHYGLAAARSGRPYACWIGTSLQAEWEARRPGLDRLHRGALAAFGPSLRRYEGAVLHGARRVYATSPYAQATVAEAAGLEPAEVGVLPIAVDLARFTPIADDTWRAALARPTVVFVGRADDPRKNAGMLIEAFALLRRDIPEARLRFVGQPPGVPLGPGVETVGVVLDVAEHVSDAALLVLPSLQEGFGIVAAEAMACGVPVVSTPSGGPEETLERSSAGRVLDGFSADELASVVHQLLESPQELLDMRARGRAYVEEHHSPQRLETLLAAALAELEAD